MKTTLNFDDRLLREAKKRAAEEGDTLTRLIERALRDYLRPRPREKRSYRLQLLSHSEEAASGHGAVMDSERRLIFPIR